MVHAVNEPQKLCLSVAFMMLETNGKATTQHKCNAMQHTRAHAVRGTPLYLHSELLRNLNVPVMTF